MLAGETLNLVVRDINIRLDAYVSAVDGKNVTIFVNYYVSVPLLAKKINSEIIQRLEFEIC